MTEQLGQQQQSDSPFGAAQLAPTASGAAHLGSAQDGASAVHSAVPDGAAAAEVMSHWSESGSNAAPPVQRKVGGPTASQVGDVDLQSTAEPATWDLEEPWRQLAGGAQHAGAAPVQCKGQGENEPAAPAPSAPVGNGAELPGEVRAKMESAFASDFSSVRIHQGPQAQSLGALAYTQGTDIFFAPGQYDPTSERGQELIGHELAHVIQQAQGRVQGAGKGANINADPALEKEADELGARAARGQVAAMGKSPSQPIQAAGHRQAKMPVHIGSGAPIQKKGDGDKKDDAVYVSYQIPIPKPMTGEQYKIAAMRQIFGGTIKSVSWQNIKDSYSPADSPVTLYVDISLLKSQRGESNRTRGFDVDKKGEISGATERAKTFQSGPESDEKSALLAEIDRRYEQATGRAKGNKSKPEEKGNTQLWRMIRDEVLFQHAYLGNLPPQVKQLIQLSIQGRDLTPADYDQLFRIAKKIEKMPPGQPGDYASKVTGGTTDLTVFESAIDKYIGEMASRGKQGEERQGIQLKLLGLEGVYQQYRQYRSMVMLDAMNTSSMMGSPNMIGGGVSFGPPVSMSRREELEKQLQANGFASVSEFEAFIKRFEQAFEKEAANIARDVLGKYAGQLHREAERYKNPQEISALHQKLGGFRAHQATHEKKRAKADEYISLETPFLALPAIQEEQAAKKDVQLDMKSLSTAHPIFNEEGLPSDKQIDKTALASASEEQLGGLLQGYIASRFIDIEKARGQLAEKSELIYKMEPLMPQFYARQGIAPGSIFDLIIRDKMNDDAILKLVGGILLAIVAIALTILSLGTATPAIVAAGAAVGSLGLSTYMAYDQIHEYTQEHDLAAVGLMEDPSLVWVVVAVFGVVADAAAAVKAVKALAPAAKLLNEGGDLAEFNKAVKALKDANELDAKIAQSIEKAAAAKKGFAEASGQLTKVLGGKLHSFPAPFTDPEVYKLLVVMAKAKLQEGVSSVQIFLDELKQARTLAKLGDLTPEELLKAKEAWEQALRLVKSSEGSIEIVGKNGELMGKFVNGSKLEIVSDLEVLHGGNSFDLLPNKTTTIVGRGTDVAVLENVANRMPGVAQSGANPGALNILRDQRWDELVAKHSKLKETGGEQLFWKTVADEFWETVNKPWLNDAIARGDQLRLVSSPTSEVAIYVTDATGKFVLDNGQKIQSLFGREVAYLKSLNFEFLPDGYVVRPK